VQADVAVDDLRPLFEGAGCVVHLAWLIQPSRDPAATRAVNVDGSRRVFEAAAAAGVTNLVYASSVGAYSPRPKDRAVDESWPTGGIQTSFYSRDKAHVERILGDFEAAHPAVRVVRLRRGLIFKAGAASGIRRLFAGPLLPTPLLRRGLIAVIPALDRLRFQGVHSLDVGEAYRQAVTPAAALRATAVLRAHGRHRSTREPRPPPSARASTTHTPTNHLQAQMQQQVAARQ
jgi:nucleoside-diphosphate-sugar epimerase